MTRPTVHRLLVRGPLALALLLGAAGCGADDGAGTALPGAAEQDEQAEPSPEPEPEEDEGPSSSLGQVDTVERSDVEFRVAEILTDLDATDEPAGATVEIDDTVLFAFDSAELEPGAAAVLDDLVEVLELLEDAPAVVRGHTDDVGDDDYNLDLSQRRADAVVAYLVDAGVDPSLLRAEGVGEAEPVVPNATADGEDDPEARARNRRVEVVLPTVDLDELPSEP